MSRGNVDDELIEIGGRKLTYGAVRLRPPLIMFHGMGDVWGRQVDGSLPILGGADFLGEGGFEIFLPNLPGYLGSDPLPKDQYSLKAYSDVLFEFCRKLGIRKAYLLGHSFGAYVVLDFAARYPELAEKVIIVGAPMHFSPSAKRAIWWTNRLAPLLVRSSRFREIFISFLEKTSFGKRWLAEHTFLHTDPYALRANIEILEKVSIPGLSDKVSAPKLFIWGENDPLSTPEVIAGIEGRADKVVLIEKAGHCPMVERPKEYARVVRDFLLGEAS